MTVQADPRLLVGALDSDEPWLRMGAILALAEVRASLFAPVLQERWSVLDPASDEFWVMAFALVRLDAVLPERVAQAAGLRDVSDLAEKLSLGWNNWVTYWRKHKKLPTAAHRALEQLWHRHRARIYAETTADESQPPDSINEFYPAVNALRRSLRLLKMLYGGSREEQRVISLIEPVSSGLNSHDPGAPQSAGEELLRIVLTDPSRAVRDYLNPVLVALPGSSTVDGLLQSLLGDPPYMPSLDQIRKMQEEAKAYDFPTDPDPMLPAWLAITFAGDALKGFVDSNAAWRIAEIAVRAAPFSRAFAESVLVGMPCDISLAALFWTAIAAPNDEEEGAARSVIEQIVVGQLNYHVPIWRISDKLFDNYDKLFENVDLGWVSALLNRIRSVPSWSDEFMPGAPFGWTSDRATTQSLLQNSIRSVVLRFPSTEIRHYASGTWDTYAHGTSGLRERLRRWMGWKGPVTRGFSLHANFPEQCPIAKALPLRIDFQTAEVDERGQTSFSMQFRGSAPASVVVLVYSNGFEIAPRHLTVSIGPDTGIASCTFQLTGQKPGRHLVEIEAMNGAEQLAYVHLWSTIAANEDSTLPKATAITQYAQSANRTETRAVIEVEWQAGNGAVFSLWDAASPDDSPKSMGRTLERLGMPEIREWANGYAQRLREYVTNSYSSDEELQAARTAISAIGLELFNQIIPQDLAAAVRTWPVGSVIGIWSNESWIPWELLSHDVQLGVWAEHFQVMRLPRVPQAGEDQPQTREDSSEIGFALAEVSTAISAVGDDIPVGDLAGLYSVTRTFPKGCAVTALREPSIRSLVDRATSTDILHLTCHGRHDSSGGLYLSLGPDVLRRLLPEHVRTIALKPGAVVFANACSSSQPTLNLSQFVSFGWRFYQRGARPFIGTLGPVPMKQAFDFAERFYHYFLVERRSAGRALRAAREEVTKRHRNPFGVLYCLYGQASVRRELPILSSGHH